MRHALALFIAEDITDNRIYQKAELIVTKFGNISQVAQLLKDIAPMVLCAWYWDDFNSLFEEVTEIFEKRNSLFEEVTEIFEKRNSHCHNVFFILDEDTYQMSSSTAHRKAMMGAPDHRRKLQEKHSLKDLRDVAKRTSKCISRLEYLLGTPSKGPILRTHFLELPEKERMKIVKRENRSDRTTRGKKKSGRRLRMGHS